MTNWRPDIFEQRLPNLKKRMQAIKAIRSFFVNQEFYEVETPILQISPVMDAHIHAFKTEFVDHAMSPQGAYYLHTSPEFAMKKLMVAGLDKIYQICHVFRNAERTARHSPEFTMIEWYRAPGDYTDIMNDCENLLRHVAQTLNITHYRHKNLACDPFKDWQRMTIAESFRNYAEIEIDDCLNDIETFRARIAEQGIRTADDDRWDDLFFRVMAEKIEPHLGMDVPTILYDYPASMASLSRKKPSDPRYAERFELYVCGIELANAFSELTNAAEQRARFIEEMALKNKLYSETYPIDEDFITALEHGLPESGGIALGLDRLIMLATGAAAIRDVLWSPVAEAL